MSDDEDIGMDDDPTMFENAEKDDKTQKDTIKENADETSMVRLFDQFDNNNQMQPDDQRENEQ